MVRFPYHDKLEMPRTLLASQRCSMLMFVDTKWAGPTFGNTVLGYGMIFGGATQLIVGFMEVRPPPARLH
jgi:hypothetical protein